MQRKKELENIIEKYNLERELEEAEKEIEKGMVYEAREVFKELRQQYGY